MYLSHTKAMVVTALTTVFDDGYPVEDLRRLWVDIEYPVEQVKYPAIWVDYEDASPLAIAGIAHVEHNELGQPFTRWVFQGYVTMTVVALSSRERDRIYDELVRVIAFGNRQVDDPALSLFRQFIEDNEFIGAEMDFDQIESRGSAAAPGTPWGGDEMTYERTIAMQMRGEFVSNPSTQEIVPLREITFIGADEMYPDSIIEGRITHNRTPSEPDEVYSAVRHGV